MSAPRPTFTTARLDVRDWHALPPAALAEFVAALLRPEVTRALPDTWRTTLTPAQAPAWIAARDEQGAILVARTADGAPIGVMTLYAQGAEVYVGYVLARAAWGQGYASELLAGFVEWARAAPTVARLVAGVTPDNPASVRVLSKCGFVETEATPELLRLAHDLR